VNNYPRFKKFFVTAGLVTSLILAIGMLYAIANCFNYVKKLPPPTLSKGYLEDKRVMQEKLEIASRNLTPQAMVGLQTFYVDNLRTREGLRKKGVKSVSGKGFAADAVPINMAIETLVLENTAAGKKSEVDHLFKRLAKNPQALAKVKSEKGAMGPLQSMEPTYKEIKRRQPKAELPDFVVGSADTKNSMKFHVLLMDDNKRCLKIKKLGRVDVKALHAAFNTGCQRAIEYRAGKRVPKETKDYAGRKYENASVVLNGATLSKKKKNT
jgi:hypothetical protein